MGGEGKRTGGGEAEAGCRLWELDSSEAAVAALYRNPLHFAPLVIK